VFSAPANNRVYKIACFQFWGGIANEKHTNLSWFRLLYEGNSPTSISLILMEICVTKDLGSTQLVHVWRGSRYRPFAWRVERLLKVVLGPLTMVMFSYNSSWVTWCVGPYAKNIVFVVWRRLSDGCLGTRGPNMVGAWDCFPWCYRLDLLWLAAKLSLVGVMWRGYIATCTTYEL
jgi:hypothetical protein